LLSTLQNYRLSLQFSFLENELSSCSLPLSLTHTDTHTHTHTRACICSQHRILCNQSLYTPHLFSPSISIFLLSCFLHFPSLVSYFYGSDIYPSETKVCAYNSSLSAFLAIFSINHFSLNPNPFSKRKKKSNSNTINESNLNSPNLKFPSKPFPLSLPHLLYSVFFLFSHLSATSQSIIS